MNTKTEAKGTTTCKVCGRDFALIAEEHYISKEAGQIGFAALAGGPAPVLFDSFDCPHCGCQNNMQQRNRLTDMLGRDLPIDEGFEEDEEGCCCCGNDSCEINCNKEEQ